MSQQLPDKSYPIGHLMPSIVLYEPSFEGWLSAVFYIYANKLQHNTALQLTDHDCYVPSLIDHSTSVVTEETKA